MNVSVASRLLGVAITIFILLLTIKSQLLQNSLIVIQITLSITFLLISMMTNAKIVDEDSFNHYYFTNRITNSMGVAFIMNAIGLLISSNISRIAGGTFFLVLIILFSWLLYLDFNKRKFYNEALILTIIALLGLLPAMIM